MRKFLACSVLAAAAFAVVAEDPKPAERKTPAAAAKKPAAAKQPVRKKVEVTLHVGDAAPALVADQWLQGDEVKSFEKGKIYVVEFWATWCGPCIVMMPHMSEMQARFKDKGVTFIGYTKKDENNTLEKVEAFVKRRGPKLGYTFCFAEEPDVYESWMAASGHGGIPCCYVVDRETKIAYMGHPMYLDLVLPKIVAGNYTPADAELAAKAEKDTDAVFESFNGKPEAALKALADFEKKYPLLNHVPYFNAPRLTNMLKLQKNEDVKIIARNLLTRARKTEDESLAGTVAAVLRGKEAKADKSLLEMSVKAADEALALAGKTDTRALLGVAQSNIVAGNLSRGKEFALKAFESAEARSKVSVVMTASRTAIETGEKSLGLELADKALETGGERMKPGLLAQLADAFVSNGDKPSGAEYAKKAIEAAPENAVGGIKVSLARTYLAAGEKKIGDTYAKEGLEASSEAAKPIMMFQLANAYYAIGEKVTARDYAEKAIDAAPAQLQRQLKPALNRILKDPDGKTTDK